MQKDNIDKLDEKLNIDKTNVSSFEMKKCGVLYRVIKRFFDAVLAFLAIIFLTIIPVLPLTAIIIKLGSKGPVLFKDKRVGKDNKDIVVFKFRSMYVDAESRIKDYLTKEEHEKWLSERKLDKDPRITPFGKFIRKTSLDELPQLFNILFGTLSFVGPRPVTRNEIELNYSALESKALLSVKPGLTGCWQVYGRSDVDYASGKRQEKELAYLKKMGIFYDLKMILLTVPSVIFHKGAK